MKRFMFVVLVALIGLCFMGGFVGCQEEKVTPPAEKEVTPPAEEKTGGDYPLSSPEAERTIPPVEETTPKGENTPAPVEK